MDKPRYLAILGLTLALTGCANLMSVHRTTDFSNGSSSFVDIKQRGVFTNAHFGNTNNSKTVIYAEPSPDALSAYSADISAKLSSNSSKSLAYAQGLREVAVFTGIRSQTIQLLRDSRYRDCEAYMNGALSEGEYGLAVRRHQRLTIALMAIEQLLATGNQPTISIGSTGRASTGGDKNLKAKQLELATEMEKLKEQIDTEDLTEEQTKALEDKLKSKEKEKAAVDEQLENVIDAEIASSTTPSVGTPGEKVRRYDENSVEAVRAIVMKVLSIDDLGSKCVIALTENVEHQAAFRKICDEYFQATLKLQSMRLQALEAKMKLAIMKDDSKEVDRVLSELVNVIPNLGVNTVIRVQSDQ
ncbi:MAG: hypothetical protein KKC58_00295 [Gammaproteobacteria bacterium]|nr:hypothetical protein [Gammaproteobacteria bacterium]